MAIVFCFGPRLGLKTKFRSKLNKNDGNEVDCFLQRVHRNSRQRCRIDYLVNDSDNSHYRDVTIVTMVSR